MGKTFTSDKKVEKKKRVYKFPEVIKDFKTTNNLSYRNMADDIGASTDIVGKWVRFESFPSLSSVMALAEAYDLSLDYLVYGEEGGRWSE